MEKMKYLLRYKIYLKIKLNYKEDIHFFLSICTNNKKKNTHQAHMTHEILLA
jgi:hypothetical protein